MARKLKVLLEPIDVGPARTETIAVRVILYNEGPDTFSISSQVIKSPSLAFELRDNLNRNVPFPPPPLPDPEAELTIIEAGKTWQEDYIAFLPLQLESGSYRVRINIQYDPEIISNWIEITIQ